MTGPFPGYADYPEVNAAIGWLADRHDAHTLWIATEWIARHTAQWQVVVGAKTPQHRWCWPLDTPLSRSCGRRPFYRVGSSEYVGAGAGLGLHSGGAPPELTPQGVGDLVQVLRP